MPTGLDLITDAMKSIGAVSAGEAPTSGESADALVALNRMIDAWGADNLTVYTVGRTVKTLTSGIAPYTIGTGGDINIVRPVSINAAGIILDSTASPTVEVPIDVLTVQRYEEVRTKGLSGSPAWAVYFDHAWTAGLGTVTVFGVPTTSTTQLVLYCPTALTTVALTGTTYTWPPGYEEALQYNLAIRLAAIFPSAPSRLPAIAKLAQDSLARIKRVNERPTELRCDPAALQANGTTRGGGRWNMNSGQWNH